MCKREFTDIEYGSFPRQKLNIYLPDTDEFDVFIYFHGGGIEGGSKEKSEGEKLDFVSTVLENKTAVVTANYRLYPDAVYPDFIRDAASVVAYVKNNIEKYGKCKRIFVGGASAGAYIAMMLCFDRRYLSVHKLDALSIDGFIFDSGQPTAHFNVLREKGIDTRRVIIDDTAPLYYVGIDKEYPPMLFVVSENDIAGRLEQTKLIISALKSFEYDMTKVEYKLMSGSHMEHARQFDENGKNLLGKLVNEFIANSVK